MEIADQFALALEFMLLGMGVVFTFLAFLVLVVKLTGTMVQKLECAEPPQAARQAASVVTASAPDETLTAVITAAVHQHRRQRSRDRSKS